MQCSYFYFLVYFEAFLLSVISIPHNAKYAPDMCARLIFLLSSWRLVAQRGHPFLSGRERDSSAHWRRQNLYETWRPDKATRSITVWTEQWLHSPLWFLGVHLHAAAAKGPAQHKETASGRQHGYPGVSRTSILIAGLHVYWWSNQQCLLLAKVMILSLFCLYWQTGSSP